jgi:hypothetical protein
MPGGADTISVRQFRSAITAFGSSYGWPTAAGMGGKADIFDLMDKIILAQREDYDQLPGLGGQSGLRSKLLIQSFGLSVDRMSF